MDIVYTWVDLRSSSYSQRFTDHGELKYSLRSIYKFAPWVRHVYIVCADDQRPEWLHERSSEANIPVYIVKHSEIIPREYLPTYNSQCIELFLGFIPGLSEHFIYFNDDMFLGRPNYPGDYFNPQPRYALHGAIPTKTHPRMGKHALAWVNTHQLLNTLFQPHKRRKYIAHQAVPLLKSVLLQAWQEPLIRPALCRTAASKYRAKHDIYFIGLCVYIIIYSKQARVQPDQGLYVEMRDSTKLKYLFKWIASSRPKRFCVNDCLTKYTLRQQRAFLEFFEGFYPWRTVVERINLLN